MPVRFRIGIAIVVLMVTPSVAHPQTSSGGRSGQQVYESVCITCHGPGGRGETEMAKTIPLPDFSDCGFANREPDEDWLAVAHHGGPARGFSPLMPPWLGTLTSPEIHLAVSHVRTFCKDNRWPRGELNLPRPLVTEKAFPEDEAVFEISSDRGDLGAIETSVIYERRFGALNQVEIALPFVGLERGDRGWNRGIGDIALGYKRTLAHSLSRGNILSLSGELVLPTGSKSKGLGGEGAVFESFATFGQMLPHNAFVHLQGGVEVPTSDQRETELFGRVAVGTSLTQPRYGRTWSPMVELLAGRPLEEGGRIEWDVVPQVQVTLSTRQHIMVSIGLRTPINERESRSSALLAYLLWDWYDGGFFSGW